MLQSQVQETFASAEVPRAEAPRAEAPRAKEITYSTEGDAFLDHYFKRIDPAVAHSFSPEQCAAIKAMFGARGIARHSFEMRRTVPIFFRRYYLVLLMGRERRSLSRLFSEGAGSLFFDLVGYAITAGLCLVPLAILLAVLKPSLGIDFLP